VQQVQNARDSVNGASKTLEHITKQLNTLVSTLSLLKEQVRLQTASVGQQLQAIIEVAEELRDFFDKIKRE
jgi:ABC-type transporter Mla subunit MlaD